MKTLRMLIVSTAMVGLMFLVGYKIADYAVTEALAQGASEVDAGPVLDAGPTPAFHETLPDPIKQPEQAIKVVKEFKDREGMWAMVAMLVFMLSATLQQREDWGWTDFLRKGRMPAVLALVTGTAGGTTDYFAGNVTWMAVAFALLTGVVAMISPKHEPK